MSEYFPDPVDRWELDWVDVGDARVCPDCRFRANKMGAKTLPEWNALGLPGAGATVCGPGCRCILLPKDILDVFPSLRGKKINLRDDEYLRVSDRIDYRALRELDELVLKYEKLSVNWNLPADYYQIYDFTERIKYLKKVIGHIEDGSIPDWLIVQIEKTNGPIKKDLLTMQARR